MALTFHPDDNPTPEELEDARQSNRWGLILSIIILPFVAAYVAMVFFY